MSAGVTEQVLDGHPAVTLTAPAGGLSATFVPGLNMVCASMRAHGHELLGQRGGLAAYAQRGSTFGIPLLHPWANRLGAWDYEVQGRRVALAQGMPGVRADSATGLPIHGLLAASPWWKLTEMGGDGDASAVRAELDFGAHADLLAAFPFPHLLTLTAALSDSALTIALTVTPTGELGVPIAFGLHPYLALPGSARATWTIAAPVRRRVVLDERGIPTGATEDIEPGALDGALAERSFDDCFDQLGPSPPAFTVADGRTSVTVRLLEGYPVAQIYAPAGQELVCFEPMTAPVDALRSGVGLRLAQPGESFTALFAIEPHTRPPA